MNEFALSLMEIEFNQNRVAHITCCHTEHDEIEMKEIVHRIMIVSLLNHMLLVIVQQNHKNKRRKFWKFTQQKQIPMSMDAVTATMATSAV